MEKRSPVREYCRANNMTYWAFAAKLQEHTGTEYPTEGTIKLIASGHKDAGRKLIGLICSVFPGIQPNDFFENGVDPEAQAAAGE